MNSGRLTNDEKDFIKKNYQRLSYKELAVRLDRRTEPIRKYVERTLGKNLVGDDEKADKAEFDIRRRPYWKDLEKQFDEDELEMFVFHWKRALSQFQDDVFHTEELQLMDAIKLDILANRLLKQQQEIKVSIEGFRGTISVEKQKPLEDQNIQMILSLEEQIASLMGAQESIERVHKDYLQEKNKILKDMKATRDQRVKRIEESGTSFIMWVTDVVSNPERRKELGLRMERMRLAMYKEKERLSQYHVYDDGELDRPFLNHETTGEDE